MTRTRPGTDAPGALPIAPRWTATCLLIGLALGAGPGASPAQDVEGAAQTVAREWSEALLFAIRRDLARPTVHARNLHRVSAAM